jgi:hypothetical protein
LVVQALLQGLQVSQTLHQSLGIDILDSPSLLCDNLRHGKPS